MCAPQKHIWVGAASTSSRQIISWPPHARRCSHAILRWLKEGAAGGHSAWCVAAWCRACVA
eukprot:11582472-Prorocentrum_lima.AAC.1